MLTNTRLRYIWCVLAGGILLYSLLPGSSRIYHLIATYDSNRWVHFLVYSAVAAIPVAACRRRTKLILALVIAALCIALEILQVYVSRPIVRPQHAIADLFGVAAGILLGSNIRMLYSSAKSASRIGPSASTSTSSPNETGVSLN